MFQIFSAKARFHDLLLSSLLYVFYWSVWRIDSIHFACMVQPCVRCVFFSARIRFGNYSSLSKEKRQVLLQALMLLFLGAFSFVLVNHCSFFTATPLQVNVMNVNFKISRRKTASGQSSRVCISAKTQATQSNDDWKPVNACSADEANEN